MDEGRTDDFSEECICLHEKLICLPGESYDNVDSEEYLRTSRNFAFLSDVSDLLRESCSVISSAHCLEDGVASGLERNVIVGEELCSGCDPVDHFMREQVRLDG